MSFDQIFSDSRVMCILRGLDPQDAVVAAERAWDAGVNVIEVPVQSMEYIASLRAVVTAGHLRGREVGAGTVTTLTQVTEVAAAGASFTVAPGFDPSIVEATAALGIPHLPGVATATEIQRAQASGCRWVKAFPASFLGSDWISAMHAPFPGLQIVATGGINGDNAGEFLSAGARMVAVGSALSDDRDLSILAALARPL